MELTTATVMSLLSFVGWLAFPVFWMLKICNRKKLPPMEDDILRVSATKLAYLIRNRKISCEEIIKAYIKRINQVNPIINAVVEDRFQEAIIEAKSVDKLLSETKLSEEELWKTKPLLGVPLTVKESCIVKGLSASVGSLRYKGKKAVDDGEVVAKVRKAGAIPLLVSNTPEMCMGWESTNHITGKSYNPYHPAHSTAGSSGGEAALVASGASVIGIGSDLAGSIRLPAHFNGVFGHKPSPRVCSIKGHIPYSSHDSFVEMLCIGPLTRFAEDLYLMMKIMAHDPEILKLDEEVHLSRLRIYCHKQIGNNFFYVNVNTEIIDLLDKTVNHFREVHQAKICTKRFKNFTKSMDMGLVLLPEATSNVLSLLEDPETGKKDLNAILELVKATFGMSVLTLNGAIAESLRVVHVVPKRKHSYYKKKKEELKVDLSRELHNDGVLLLPTFYTTALQNGQAALKPKGYMYTMLFNLLGFPATHVPMGLGKNGLPIGIQVVAGPLQDRLCLAVAKELERLFKGWVEP